MPILAHETSLFPDNLLEEDTWFDDPRDADATDRKWSVLYTKPRQEKALARDLTDGEIPFFLPLVPRDLVIRKRRVRSYHPLFTGYLFLYGNREGLRGQMAHRIAYAVPVVDQLLLHRELRQIHQLIASGAPLTVERRLQPGQAVRIKSGSFAGIEGAMISRRGRTRLLVAVKYLGQGVSLEIDDFQLEPL